MQEKLGVADLGPDQPHIVKKQAEDRGGRFTRLFHEAGLLRSRWLTACSEVGAEVCFPCLLFQTAGNTPTRIQSGMTDLKHCTGKVMNKLRAT